jgi:predicted CoA-binding protein
MATHHERFWESSSFAFVGHSAVKPFPVLSYGELRKQPGKQVFAIDPSADEVEGERAYPDFAALPQKVDAAVLEVPRDETADWVRRAADAGVASVWIHMGRETPEALQVAADRGLDVHTGTCAVMYVKRGFSYHSLHKWVNQLTGRY